MSAWPNLEKPETLKPSVVAYECYRNDNSRLHNSVARRNPEQSIFDAMHENKENYEKLKTTDGKSVVEIIRKL
jgi:hypothetical protein